MSQYIRKHLVNDEHIICETTYHWIIFISFFAIFTLFLSPIIQFNTSEFCLTNRRIVFKLGLIRLKVIGMNLSKIESIEVDQNLLGRLLGYGTLSIHGTGGTMEKFFCVKQPLEFKNQFDGFSH
jgi:uncharacterized membrane protein YdbT with pleckstrin-like domain